MEQAAAFGAETPRDRRVVSVIVSAPEPAWLEITTVGLDGQAGALLGAVGEFDEPYLGKTLPLLHYEGGVYRLECNPELYEGVRYAWLCFAVSRTPTAPPACRVRLPSHCTDALVSRRSMERHGATAATRRG